MITQDDLYAELTVTFREIFRDPKIMLRPESTPETIGGWDSFKYVSVLVALEAAYGIELDGPELDSVQNVGELVALIEAKAAAMDED
jgi:acyl carrier protein